MFDKGLIGSDFMGAIHVPLSLLNNGETLDHWFDLSPYKGASRLRVGRDGERAEGKKGGEGLELFVV